MASEKIKGFKQETQKNILSSISKTSGSSTMLSAEFSRRGNTAVLTISIRATADVARGNDAFVGTISSDYRPVATSRGVGFSGGTVIVGVINSNGNLSARVVNETFPNTWTSTISITYVID